MSDKIELYVNDVMVFQQTGAGPGPTPTGPTPPTPTGPTPPPQGDGLDAARARQWISQNCLWVLTTSAESGALAAKVGPAAYAQYIQFYTVGGTGSVAPNEVVNAGSPSGYSYWTTDQQLLADVNQAADAYVALRCQQEGKPPPPAPANLG